MSHIITSTRLIAILLLSSSGLAAQDLDRELTGKVMTGYQGWFRAEGDGSKERWRHYSLRGKFEPGHCSIDFWPDLREAGEDERFKTAFRHRDGRVAEVFSSYHQKTVDRHFRWMKDYGLDGAFVQRFARPLLRRGKDDRVLMNCRAAATKHGRLWSVMYDLSGLREGQMDVVKSDWRRLQKLGVLEDKTYLHHDRRPLVAIWGVGFNDGRKYTLAECRDLIRFFKSDAGGRCAVMLGTPFRWREQRRDSLGDKILHTILAEADIISPWSVGRFTSPKAVATTVQQHWKEDMAWCRKASLAYMPVVFPGFSWHNLRAGKTKLDQIPRRGGKFLWQQFVSAKTAGAKMIYIAMFDEVDEGTAIFKCTNDPPVGASPFLDYEGLPTDHYLWLSGEGARLLRGKRKLSVEFPKRSGRSTKKESAQGSPPNVILIMVDDLGYRDLGCYGHTKIKTPVLDKLARDGIFMTSFYSGASVCTPSRMALLTGAYPTRLGWTKGVMGYLISTKRGLSPKALTIAEVFKQAGYKTGLIGKWHLGERPKFLPQRQGFDHTYYVKSSNNQTKKLWRGDELIENPFENRLLTEKFSSEAIRFIKANKDKPFFLYLPYTAPHFPVQAHPDWKGKSAFGVYGDVVEELDHRIGDILSTLEAEKLDKRTIVLFLSDNGPQKGEQSRATPFRGEKWHALEGGTRVPCIVRFPGVIPAGQESDALIGAIDILPSLSHACGIDLASVAKGSPKIDGVNVWDTWIGKKGAVHPRKDLLYWHGKNGFHAIRRGDWKLFLDREGAQLPPGGKGPVLFHLAKEVDEKTDVSAEHPEKVKELLELARKRVADVERDVIPLGK